VCRLDRRLDRRLDLVVYKLTYSLPDLEFQDQMAVLEDAFSPQFSFDVVNITTTVNDEWFSKTRPRRAVDLAMKEALRAGGRDALNIFINGYPGGGYATFPEEFVISPETDGVVVQGQTLPGGSDAPYNLGTGLVHEVGHWLGLFHTFQGGCTGFDFVGKGDSVRDTPPEASPAIGCPVGRDTCNGQGEDPIQYVVPILYLVFVKTMHLRSPINHLSKSPATSWIILRMPARKKNSRKVCVSCFLSVIFGRNIVLAHTNRRYHHNL